MNVRNKYNDFENIHYKTNNKDNLTRKQINSILTKEIVSRPTQNLERANLVNTFKKAKPTTLLIRE